MPDNTNKSIEQWLWDAAYSIRDAKDAPKYKDYPAAGLRQAPVRCVRRRDQSRRRSVVANSRAERTQHFTEDRDDVVQSPALQAGCPRSIVLRSR